MAEAARIRRNALQKERRQEDRTKPRLPLGHPGRGRKRFSGAAVSDLGVGWSAAPLENARAETAQLGSQRKEAPLGARMMGTCKWFDAYCGWGFVTPHDHQIDDVFVYQALISNMPGFRCLSVTDVVEFSIGQDDRGRKTATDVVVLQHDIRFHAAREAQREARREIERTDIEFRRRT